MLKQRIITGLILICIVFGSILWLPSQGFAALALLIIVGLGSWEWANLTECHAKQQRALGALALMAVTRLAAVAADVVGAHREPAPGAFRHRRENPTGAGAAGRA